jgi:hypothetical protein
MVAARHGFEGIYQLPTWDFVLRRDDGSAIRLHPQWTSLEVLSFPAEGWWGYDGPNLPPKAGLGKSDGPGTYNTYEVIGAGRMLKFDERKAPTWLETWQ